MILLMKMHAVVFGNTANYEAVYETVTKEEGPSIKIVDSQQFIVTGIRGYLSLKVVHFVMNLHTLPRTFYISRYVLVRMLFWMIRVTQNVIDVMT